MNAAPSARTSGCGLAAAVFMAVWLVSGNFVGSALLGAAVIGVPEVRPAAGGAHLPHADVVVPFRNRLGVVGAAGRRVGMRR